MIDHLVHPDSYAPAPDNWHSDPIDNGGMIGLELGDYPQLSSVSHIRGNGYITVSWGTTHDLDTVEVLFATLHTTDYSCRYQVSLSAGSLKISGVNNAATYTYWIRPIQGSVAGPWTVGRITV